MNRRTFLLAGAALAATTGSACSGSAGLEYWNLFGGGDGSRMTEMVGAIGTRLDAVTLAWGTPYYTKLAMAAAGGRAPDLAILHLSRMPGFAPLGLLDPFDGDLLAAHGLTSDRFPEAVWSRARHNGRTYAVPLDTHPLVLFYNTELCGKAGLLENGRLKPIRGPEQLLDAFGKAGLALAAARDVNPWRLFWTLYRQQNGEGPLDDAKALTALRLLAKVGATTRFTDNNAAVALFGSGQAGFFWNGEWELPTFQEQHMPFDVAPFPQVYERPAVHADSHAFVLPHQRNRDPQRTERTVAAIAELIENSLTWARGGHIPAYQPVATSPAYLKLLPQANYRSEAAEVELDPAVWFAGAASDLQSAAGATIGSVLGGTMSPEGALDALKATLVRLQNTPRPS
ncbi:extracellular solute-binding protein [Kutzneria buriramensis]|uniref:Multiple sugar transport system substrate-binding protein n=1 Tax=Kutzneria buriramensis TaxID=1045776 RepID=A0A3E0HZQ5_9PSEU|nr:extracellular solute-binding protein [Kutzneria buriramensis]REH51948.1 multiple sugar transport system substrate-binding protein [Kutzneria buriramensis]